jgi:hypothetical protein
MERELKDLSFDEWVKYVFDHRFEEDVGDRWYHQIDRVWWDEMKSPVITITYLTQLFENIREIAVPYSDAQLGDGLWFLCDNACSSHMFTLLDVSVPLANRLRCFEAMYQVYEGLFAPKCSPSLGHLSEDSNMLNLVCYMWWDIIPIYGKPNEPERAEIDKTVLEVMAKTLELNSVACQEGALHGLGHWCDYYPQKVGKIIDDFLAQNPSLRPELKQYALNARRASVL